MEDFLRYLISPLLNSPNQLEIEVTPSSVGIKVDPADAGRIIGRHGQVINSLRVLLKSYCALHRLPLAYLHLEVPPLVPITLEPPNTPPVSASPQKVSRQNR